MAKKTYVETCLQALPSILNPRLRRLQLTNDKRKHFYKRIIQTSITHNIKEET